MKRGKHFSKAVFFTPSVYNGFHQGNFPWRDINNSVSRNINDKYNK